MSAQPSDIIERYIIECGYTQRGTSLRTFETFPMDPERAACRRNVIEDICSGQIEADQFTTIYHASTEQPLQDVTKEIAEDVANALREERADEVNGRMRDFLEQHLGVYAVERLVGARVAA